MPSEKPKRLRPTIVVDPEDGGVMTGIPTETAPGFKPNQVVERLYEQIPEAGEPCVLDGHPCILFADWDYAECWSGRYVRELHPFLLLFAPKITRAKFWILVREVHAGT